MSGQGIPLPWLKDNRLLLPLNDVDLATYGFGVGNFYLTNGEKDKARAIFEQVMKGPAWNAFGYIAAEAELARMK